jgi:hypothetical protein
VHVLSVRALRSRRSPALEAPVMRMLSAPVPLLLLDSGLQLIPAGSSTAHKYAVKKISQDGG